MIVMEEEMSSGENLCNTLNERESARQHKCAGGNETKNDRAIWRFKRRTENCDL